MQEIRGVNALGMAHDGAPGVRDIVLVLLRDTFADAPADGGDWVVAGRARAPAATALRVGEAL